MYKNWTCEDSPAVMQTLPRAQGFLCLCVFACSSNLTTVRSCSFPTSGLWSPLPLQGLNYTLKGIQCQHLYQCQNLQTHLSAYAWLNFKACFCKCHMETAVDVMKSGRNPSLKYFIISIIWVTFLYTWTNDCVSYSGPKSVLKASIKFSSKCSLTTFTKKSVVLLDH